MKKLNGWQRIGVVLSILWILGAAIHERNGQVDFASKINYQNIALCFQDMTKSETAKKECLELADSNFRELLSLDSGSLWNIAAISLIPVLLGWLFAWLAIVVYRWVLAGFRGLK
jgi:hypothetical protein